MCHLLKKKLLNSKMCVIQIAMTKGCSDFIQFVLFFYKGAFTNNVNQKGGVS